jgi:2-polyprenyl-3-methyl-5-hydroxy-6-metoxy-1,4-benzoquinol methylase
MSTNGINQQKVEAFAERMIGVLNEGALALMSSIGHRTHLFDTMAQLPPATSGQIAEAVGLNERYVREWLNTMVVGRVVDYEPTTKAYHLPMEHAAFLTRAAGADNLAFYSQYIGLFGTIEDKIIDCFYKGGGLPYAAFGRFHEIMAEDSGMNIVEPLLDTILPLVPGLMEELHRGIEVMDVGCGRGRAMLRMAQAFPNSRFHGFDFSEEAIAIARADVEKMKLANLHFEVKDAATWHESNRYDLITTFDAIHDQAQPGRVLSNIFSALKPGGVYLMQDVAGSSHVHQDFDLPLGPLLYTVSTMHCMSVSLAQNGAGLGTMWGKEKALELLGQAGFSTTEVHQLPHDIANYYYVSTK